ncbi:MAG: phage terminase large subunit [Gammaproteobacteria bacterium]|nr:MAG: phage terminase large subunit [Gammaproteobacteria bacterium]
MLFGGSRSGKTFLLVRHVITRAQAAPGSRHAILRFRFSHVKQAVIHDTFPKVMALCFPGVTYDLNKTDFFVRFDNGAEIWFGGLDDKERTEKILGQEYVTIYLNECSQIPGQSREIAITRLAQKVGVIIDGQVIGLMKPQMLYDCNPPSKAHWSYKLFILKQDPETKKKISNAQDYAYFKINPEDNQENLTGGYIQTLQGLSARLRKRFLQGDFADATPNQLFSEEDIEKWRHTGGKMPDMVRVVVAVDPSGSGDVDNVDNDAIGIVVMGLGTDGNGYLLEDLTVKAGPGTWGKVATDAYERHEADVIVGEGNYGGAMVEFTIKVSAPRANFKMVHASRGKAVRAEPFSALYEQGKVRHVGYFMDLEDELVAFSTAGYLGEDSPNRADALIWALSELFSGLVRKKPKVRLPGHTRHLKAPSAGGWMG